VATTIVLVFLLVIVLASLIPAVVIKLLMRMVFRRRVSFWMVLLGAVLASVVATAAYVGMVYLSEVSLEALASEPSVTPVQGLAFSAASFLVQLLVFAFVVPDENMELIAISCWLVVLLLQYVVYAAVAVVFALVSMQVAGASQAMLQ